MTAPLPCTMFSGNATTVARVLSAEHKIDMGLYNPYTTQGFVVVDGVVASGQSVLLMPELAGGGNYQLSWPRGC